MAEHEAHYRSWRVRGMSQLGKPGGWLGGNRRAHEAGWDRCPCNSRQRSGACSEEEVHHLVTWMGAAQGRV
jgi:hypothetical protein